MTQLTLPVGARDHSQGQADAPITLVEYGDYECSHCGHAYTVVKAIQDTLGDRLRFIFRNFPLKQIHPHAEHAAEAAEAAGAQGKFWEMHDLLFENQSALDDNHLTTYASKLGIEIKSFQESLTDHTFEGRVKEDFLSGVRSGVNGTPTFFINGTRHDGGWDQESLMEAIENRQ